MSAPVSTIQSTYHQIADTAAREGWREIPLEADIAHIAAKVGEDTVTMRSRAWSSGRFRLVRETLMESERKIQVFNLVAYPRSAFDAPVFATDVVVIGGKLRIGVVDAMPLFPEEPAYRTRWIEPFLPLEARARDLAPRFALKMEWSRHYLGDAACLATGIPVEEIGPVLALGMEYWEKYLAMLAASLPVDSERQCAVEKWIREYNQEHAEVELKRNPLVRYYGEEYGRRFIEGFLFSDSLGT